VPYEVARERIEAHLRRIAERRRPLGERYGESEKATLSEAFARHDVDELAYGYVGSWSSNMIYYWWATEVRVFYDRHTNILRDSMRAIGRDGIGEEHLDYLDKGMEAWLAEEKAIGPLMEEYVDMLGQRAKHLGEGMRIHGDPRTYDYSHPDSGALRQAYEEQRRLAEAVPVGTPLRQVRAYYPLQLFSALDVDPAERIPVDNSPPDSAIDSCIIDIGDPLAGDDPFDPLDRAGDEFINAIGDRVGKLLEQLDSASDDESRRGVLSKTDDLTSELLQEIHRRKVVGPDPNPDTTSRMRNLLEPILALREELGSSLAPPGTSSRYSSDYLPDFVPGSAAAQSKQEWLRVLTELRAHQASMPDIRREFDKHLAWHHQRERLRAELLLAEQEIAWNAAVTPFSDLPRLKDKLAQLGRKSAAAAAAARRLAAYDEELGRYLKVDRNDMRYIALLRFGQEICRQQRDEQDEEIRAALAELDEFKQRVDVGFLEALRSRRQRGIEAIRERQRAQAQAAGREVVEPFRIHRPPQGSEAFGRLIAEKLKGEMAANAAVELSDAFKQGATEHSDALSKVLDSEELDRLLR
jgi:hypothetical protein